MPPVDPWVALLPSLDPTTMGWKEREWYLGPHAPRLFDSNGNAGQTIWVDGKIVGAWGQRVSGEVVWELLEDIGRESLAEVERQAAEVETWLSDKRVIARFASPLDRELSARSTSLAYRKSMTSLQARIREDLAEAMRDRDMARVKVLRTTMSAIQNAEAVEGVASVEGVVGYSDVQRRSLTDDDVIEIIIREIEEFEGSVAEYRQIGQTERADGLQRELEVLRSYLNPD